MSPVLQVVVTALEAVGAAFGRSKPKTPAEMERQSIQHPDDRAMVFFVLFALVLSAVLLAVMALR